MAIQSLEIGFLGIGLMGHGMAENLLRAGHKLTIKGHRNRSKIADLTAKGAHEAGSFHDVTDSAEVIFLCLSNSNVAEAVIAGLYPHLHRGQMVIDMGTSRPQSTKAIAKELANKGVDFAEAPVAGGPQQARNGELGAMVGASRDVFERIEPLLKCFCSRISHMGGVGTGQTAKLINNYLVCGMIALITDCYKGARQADIDWQQLFNVMQCGSNNSPALQKIIGPALNGDFDGYQFSIANAEKDMRYYQEIADQLTIASPLGEKVHAVFAKAVENGLDDQMVSRLLDPVNADLSA